MKRVCLAAAASLGVVLLTACAGSETIAPSPTSPTPPAASSTVTGVIVTSQSTSSTTFQLAATARMSDGASRDVTTASLWQSSDPSIATITPSGLLTAFAQGEIDVRATYQGVTGTLRLSLSRMPEPNARYALSGTAHEPKPDARVLAGVRIQITSGPDAGMSIVTGADGAFRFAALSAAAPIAMEATKEGYLPWRLSNLTLDKDRVLDVDIFPMPPKNADGVPATARCNDRTWSWAQKLQLACVDNGGVAYTVCPGPMCGLVVAQ
jgi:hypothetical protein